MTEYDTQLGSEYEGIDVELDYLSNQYRYNDEEV